MFLFRVKVEELDSIRLTSLKDDLTRGEENLRAQCPIREMSVVEECEGAGNRKLDICLALDDFVAGEQLRRLVGELNSLLDFDPATSKTTLPRFSSELIQI